MRFKFDENFGTRTQKLFQDKGHNVETVRSQGIEGCSDQILYEVCLREKRCLITLDLDFADVTRFSPSETNGIVIIRVPQNPSLPLLEQLIQQFLQHLTSVSVAKSLWIVESGRIRIHESGIDTET
jgi:predicted nuclease of predicted toxin-antitoxin system